MFQTTGNLNVKPKPVLFNKKYVTKPVQKHLSVTLKHNWAAAIHRIANCFSNTQ
jgi:hypothetical protein